MSFSEFLTFGANAISDFVMQNNIFGVKCYFTKFQKVNEWLRIAILIYSLMFDNLKCNKLFQ